MTLSWPQVRRELLLAAAFAAMGGGLAYLGSEAESDRSQATVAWSLNDDHAALARALDTDLRPELERLAQASRSRDVIADALERVDGQAPNSQRIDALLARTETTIERTDVARGNAALLRVRVTGTTREDAFTHAQALATALESWERRTAAPRLHATLSALDAEIERLSRDVRTLQVLDDRNPERDATRAELESRIAQRDQAAALASSDGGVAVLDRDPTVTGRTGPNTARNVTASAGLAALLGVAVGLRVRRPRPGRRRPRRSGTSADERLTRSPPLLARFPRATAVVTLRGAAARLRARLTRVLPDARPWVIVVAGADEREGATTVACQLAEAWALVGHATLLLDGHLSAPAVASRFGLPADPSIATSTLGWLQDPKGDHQLMKVTLDNGAVLDVVPQFSAARPSPGTAAEMYRGFPELLSRWSHYDAIVVDAAGLLEMEDTLLMAPHATGVVLVLDRGRIDRARVIRAADAVKRAGATLLGVVDDDPPPLPDPSTFHGDDDGGSQDDDRHDAIARAFGRDG